MIYLEHNTNTSLLTLAQVMKDELDKISTIYNIDDLRNGFKVSIIENDLKGNLNTIISSVDNLKVPNIILARGNSIRTDETTLLKYENNQNIEMTNNDNSYLLDGVWFEYDVDFQIIILSSNSLSSLNLQLEIKRIISTKLKSINYSLRVNDDENPNEFYRCDNFGEIQLKGFENAQFEQQSDENSIAKAMYISGVMTEQYFKLHSSDIHKKHEIFGIPKY
jgi:hypothetical protein